MYIYPHDKCWKTLFYDECERVRACFSAELELHHVGSTAVIGLMSKNCIDIAGVIDEYAHGNEAIAPLTNIGYRYKGEYGIADRHYFTKESNAKNSSKVHLHILPRGHEQIQRHLHFVEIMTARPDLVDEFNQLKTALSQSQPKEIYQDRKSYFYEKVRQISL